MTDKRQKHGEFNEATWLLWLKGET
jgi:hypothetical protein